MNKKLDFSLHLSFSGNELLDGTGRVARVRWLDQRIHRNDLFFFQDGEFSQLLFNDLLECFVGGQFIATIVLGFSFIERSIAGRLCEGENKSIDLSSELLITSAFQKKWITEVERDRLNELRSMRNPIVHFKKHSNQNRPENRASRAAKTTQKMLEEDAKQMLEASINILSKTAL